MIPTSLAIGFIILGIITAVGNCYEWDWYESWTAHMWASLDGQDNRRSVGLLSSFLALIFGFTFFIGNSSSLNGFVSVILSLIISFIIAGGIYFTSKANFLQPIISRFRNSD